MTQQTRASTEATARSASRWWTTSTRRVPATVTSRRRVTNMRKSLGVCLAVLVSGAGIVYPQQPSSPGTQGRLEVNVVQVPLLVTVTDNKRQLITTLNKNDFRIYEGNRLQKIDSFSRDADLPLSIALLIDQSSSTIDNLEFERAAALNFFSSTVKRRKDRAMVIGFATDAHMLVDFTDDPADFAAGLKKLSA